MVVILQTELSPDECLRRLGESGWAGKTKPHRWQPTATDPNVLRVVKKSAFQLWSRSWKTAAYPGRGLPSYFYGRVEPEGHGARITGYLGTSRWLKVSISLTAMLGFLFLMLIDRFHDVRFGGAEEHLRMALGVALVAAFVGGIYFGVEAFTAARSRDEEERFANHLAEALDAHPTHDGADKVAREWRPHATLPSWGSRGLLGLLLLLTIASMAWAIRAALAEDDYRARATLYENAPACASTTGMDCRATETGAIVERYWRSRGKQWLWVRLPNSEHPVALAYTREERRHDKPDKDAQLQSGTTLKAELWEGQIVALTAEETTLRTSAHPAELVGRNAADQRLGTLAAVTFATVAILSRAIPWITGRFQKSSGRVSVP